MSDPDDPLAWVAKAEEDYRTTLSILRRQEPFTSIACFHAQQRAEKYLKAMLVARKRPFAKVHDLVQISDLSYQAGILVPVDQDALDRLSKFAVTARYPGSAPTLAQAREAYQTARTVRKFARKILGL